MIINQSLFFIWIFFIFSLMSSFWTRIPPKRPHSVSSPIPPRLLLPATVSQTFLFFFFDDLENFEADRSGILQNVLQLGFVRCSPHNQTEVMCFGRKTPEVKRCSPGPIEVTHCECDRSLLSLTLITWLGEHLPGFSAAKFLFPSFLHCPLWKEVTMCHLHSRSRELWSPSLMAEYLHKLFGIPLHRRYIYSLFCLFIQSFIYITMDSQIFYTLGYNPILLSAFKITLGSLFLGLSALPKIYSETISFHGILTSNPLKIGSLGVIVVEKRS